MGKRRGWFFVLLALFLVVLSSGSLAAPLDNWYLRTPLPQVSTLNNVVYGNNTFVAVGAGGAILTSPDGIRWTSNPSGCRVEINGVTYGNGVFVAVGGSGTVLTSADGVTWTEGTPVTTKWLYGVTYGSKTFVAVGNGVILTSTDGITWTSVTVSNLLLGVAYGDGVFVAVGDRGTILTSPDNGISWMVAASKTPTTLFGVVYGNNTFMAVGWNGTVLTSVDKGGTWVPRVSKVYNCLFGVTYGNNTFVAVGENGTILTSPDDKISWTSRVSGIANRFYGVTYSNGIFVVVGEDETILASSDGVLWENKYIPYSLADVTCGKGTFVAVGNRGGGSEGINAAILTSTDGIAWADRSPEVTDIGTGIELYSASYGNGTFVVVGQSGKDAAILTSSDGISWTINWEKDKVLWDVEYVNNIFLIVGMQGIILTSPDGISWTTRRWGDEWLWGAAYGNDTFVAVGVNLVDHPILTSSDGISWTRRPPAIEAENGYYGYCGVTYGNGTFVVVGNCDGKGIVLTSYDGIEWTGRMFGPAYLGRVTYGGNNFVAITDDAEAHGIISTSADGISWARKISGITDCFLGQLFGITYGNGTFVAVGCQAILQSGQVVKSSIISVSPTSLNFDSVNVGGSLSKPVIVKNTGQSNLVISAMITGANAADFKNDTCYVISAIAPLASRTINVIFSPKSEGLKTARLLISSNDPYNSTVTVSLTGCGLSVPPTVNLAAVPSSGQEPLKVDFVANAHDADGVVVKYLWSFDDGHAGFCESYNTTGCSKVSYTYKKAGTYNPKVVVTDDDGLTAEKSMTIKVTSSSPDLKIYDIYSDSKKRLCIKIGNVGTVEVKATRLDIRLDGKPKFAYTISNLEPNGVRIIQSAILSGRHTIEAVIDPKNAIKEVDELNNTMKKTINFK